MMMLVKKGWDIYNDESLDYKRCKAATPDGEVEPVKIQQFLVAFSEAGSVDQHVMAPLAA